MKMGQLDWTQVKRITRAILTGEVIEISVPQARTKILVRFDNFIPYGQALPFGAVPGEWTRLHLPTTVLLGILHNPKSPWVFRLLTSLTLERKD